MRLYRLPRRSPFYERMDKCARACDGRIHPDSLRKTSTKAAFRKTPALSH